METADLLRELESNGYTNIRLIPGRGLCGLHRLLFTTGIVYGLDLDGYKGRFCYHTKPEALKALELWDGSGDPSGDWIVNKGERGGDRQNPRLQPPPTMVPW